jgi:predicted glycosyltransferase
LRILIDILHPAHVHFFRNAISALTEVGHDVLVTARDKDLTLRLLDLYRIPCTCISREAKTKAGLVRELVSRNWRLLKLVKREKPRVLASIGGISTAQVGFLTRTRNLIFYDTENATLSNLLSYPLATEVITPICYRRKVYGRHVTYPGYHELAYLHPARFTPDTQVLVDSGIDPTEPYSVIRFVSWKAVHDVKARGHSPEEKLRLASTLERHGKVYITSESPLPAGFDKYRLPISPEKVHHLLAFARLFVGESATMASESVILGTPAIYVDAVGRGPRRSTRASVRLRRSSRPM